MKSASLSLDGKLNAMPRPCFELTKDNNPFRRICSVKANRLTDRSRSRNFQKGPPASIAKRAVSLKIYAEDILDEWNTYSISSRGIGRPDANISQSVSASPATTLRDFQSGRCIYMPWAYATLPTRGRMIPYTQIILHGSGGSTRCDHIDDRADQEAARCANICEAARACGLWIALAHHAQTNFHDRGMFLSSSPMPDGSFVSSTTGTWAESEAGSMLLANFLAIPRSWFPRSWSLSLLANDLPIDLLCTNVSQHSRPEAILVSPLSTLAERSARAISIGKRILLADRYYSDPGTNRGTAEG